MSRVAPGLVLSIALVATTAHADPILYATAATTGELTSYCVGRDGGMEPAPRQRITTLGSSPSRIVQHAMGGKQFLYVAENDRVEVYEVGERGGLIRNGRIPARPIPADRGSGLTGMNPHDLAIGEAAGGGFVLYVPQRAFDRIAAFPLDPTTGLSTVRTAACTGGDCRNDRPCAPGQTCSGGVCVQGATCSSNAECGSGQTCDVGVCLTSCVLPEGDNRSSVEDPTCASGGGFCTAISDQTGASCILGPIPSQWEDLQVANQLLYISRAVNRGEVFVYQLAPDANFANGEVILTQSIGSETNPEQCGKSRGCTTGASCGVDADCTAPPGATLRCVAGACVNLSMTCDANKDCPADQTCATFGPCDQNAKAYVVPSTNCTTPIVITDVNGAPITQPPTTSNPDPAPITVTGQIEPYARRRRLNGAGALAMQDDILYVSERFRRAISAFALCPADGQPVVCTDPPATGKKGDRCTCPDSNSDRDPDVDDLCPPFGFSVDAKFNDQGLCTVRFRQPRLAKNGGRTTSDIRYNAMTLAQGMNGSTLLGAQFLDGRIDGYRLKSDGRLPKTPTQRTRDNFRTSPFNMFVYRPSGVSPANSAGVLYVGAGDINRVQAYRLFANGNLRDRTPFSETDVLDDTFPNEVTVVDLPGPCF